MADAKKKLTDREMRIMADVMRRDRIDPSDPAFADKVSPYMAGEIDPSVARHIPLDYDDSSEVTLKGLYYQNESGEPYKVKGGRTPEGKQVSVNPGDVSTFHTSNTPQIFGHEFRHKNYPNLTETENRSVDMVTAQTDHDVDSAIRMQANRDRLDIPSEAIDGIKRAIRWIGIDHYNEPRKVLEEELERMGIDINVKELIKNSAMQTFIDEVDDLEKWNKGLSKRNKARKSGEPETWGDSIRQIWGDD